jgi:hypothetical protein
MTSYTSRKPKKDGAEAVKEFKPAYFMAEMKNGIIDLRNVEVLR